MRILVLPAGPAELPASAQACTLDDAMDHPADVVLLRSSRAFPEIAQAFVQQQRGAIVVAIGPSCDLPSFLALDDELPAGASLAEQGECLDRLCRLRQLERASITLTALYDDRLAVNAPRDEVGRVYASVQGRLQRRSGSLREALEGAWQMQEALEAENALRSSAENRLALLGSALDDLSEGVCLATRSGMIVSTNRAFRVPGQVQGTRGQEGGSLDALFRPADAGGPGIREVLACMAEATRATGRFRRRSDSGEVLVYSASFARMRPRAGEPEFVVAVFRDTTEHDALMARVVQSERLSALGQLSASVAHEVSNPLAYVVNLLYVLRSRSNTPGSQANDGPPSVDALLDKLDEGCRRIGAVIANLKHLSRADAGTRTAVDLRNVVDFALQVVSNELRHRARVVYQSDRVPLVAGNEARLGQVLINVLFNAMQALPAGHADRQDIRVWLGTSPEGEAVIEVADSGEGIAPEHLDRVFDPFFTTKGDQAGTGLGLSICRDIIREHGGRIALTSERGRGTTVRIVLPSAKVPVPSQDFHAPPSVREALRITLLVVDDEPDLRNSLTWLLAPLRVCAVGTIEEAKAAIVREKIDVVLCDLQLPCGLGTELLAWLRQRFPKLACRFALMSGGALGREGREAIDSCGVPVLDKPFAREDLLALVESLGVSSTPA